MTNQPGSSLVSTKLVVKDLQREAEFYRSVCGYGEGIFIRDQLAGRPIDEIIFVPEGGGHSLILFTYTDGGEPSSSGVMLVYFTSDLDAFEARVLAAGGTVHQAKGPIELPSGSSRMGVFADPEGFLLEVIESV
ncbi:VOC family protein [Novosphingobium malaysiense]|uniref:VOC family protein n=1 Tax=Novosphingobium malaysiense TaxID=1348853 RepID=UPI00068F4B72|nr:VOC family protein [Novosphingobium malaysiense]